jgi:hypothetical protein
MPLLSGTEVVDDERLLDRGMDTEARVERLVRVLVDDLQPAAELPQPPRRHTSDVLSAEADETLVGLLQAEDRLRCCRLPTPRLTDEGEHFTAAEHEGDPFNRVDAELGTTLERAEDSARDRVADDEVLDLEDSTAVRGRRVRQDAATMAWSLRWQAAM